MGFSKKTNEPEIRIEVLHQWHPDTIFAFTFPKRMPQPAAEAEARYLGLTDKERSDEYRTALVATVAAAVTCTPEGFDDLPGSTIEASLRGLRAQLATTPLKSNEKARIESEIAALERELEQVNQTPLAERVRAYFDDPEQVEFEDILSAAYRGYRLSAMPSAYPKSLQISSAGDGDLSRTPAQTPT